MKRRQLIALLGAGAVAWPGALVAQSTQKVRRVGVLMATAASDPEGHARLAAFRQALQELGWTDGHNIRLEPRWFGGDADAARVHAEELVGLAPDAIVVNGAVGLRALRQETGTIPIIFVLASYPVGSGYVASLARPGGNITGFSTYEPEIGGKWLEALKEIAPALRRVAVLFDPDLPGFTKIWGAIETMAPRLGLEAAAAAFHAAADIDRAITAFAREPNGGLIVLPHPLTTTNRDLIVGLAARHRLPALYPFRFFAASGGLMSYGIDISDLFRRSAGYADRILKGANPGELPVQAPSKFELVINLKTAAALGLAVPAALLARADEVIE